MVYGPPRQLTVEQLIARYGDDLRYELADGDLVDMEPTGPHEAVSGKVTARLILAIAPKIECKLGESRNPEANCHQVFPCHKKSGSLISSLPQNGQISLQ